MTSPEGTARLRALLTVGLLSLLAAGSAAQGDGSSRSLGDRLAAIDGQGADRALAGSLVPLSDETLREVLELVEPRAGHARLTPGARATLSLALESGSAQRVAQFLDQELRASEPDPEGGASREAAALWMLERAVDPSAAPVIVRVANRAPAQLERAFRSAITPILSLHPALAEQIHRALDPELVESLAQVLGEVGDPRSLPTLVALLQRAPGGDAGVLRAVARLTTRFEGPYANGVRRAVRPYLYRAEGDTLLAAIEALGGLEDRESTEELLPFLRSREPRTLGAAHRALKRISSQSLPAREADWMSWFRQQDRWWQDAAPGLVRTLEEGSPLQISQALRQITQHPLYRHELAPAVAELLEHPDPVVTTLACSVLGQLGSAMARPALERALQDPRLAADARQALERLAPGSAPTTRP